MQIRFPGFFSRSLPCTQGNVKRALGQLSTRPEKKRREEEKEEESVESEEEKEEEKKEDKDVDEGESRVSEC